jgi:hypothetical protein
VTQITLRFVPRLSQYVRHMPADSVSLRGLPAGTTNLVAIGLSGGSIVDQYFFSASRAGTYTRTFPAIAHVSTTVVNRALARPGAPNSNICTTHYDRSLGHPWGIVGGVNSTTNGGTDDFVYTQSASSSIGIGTSASGAAGTFSASGSNSVATTATTDFGGQWFSWGSHQFKSEFTENEYYNFCYNPNTGVSSYTYYNRTDGWYGGAAIASVGPLNIPLSNCVPYQGNTTFTKTTTSAWNFGSGVGIPYINFNASAQTGYTSEAAVSFHFNTGDNRHLCGAGGSPGGNSPRLLQVES